MALFSRHRIREQEPWKSLKSLAFSMVRHANPRGPMKRGGSEHGVLTVSCFPPVKRMENSYFLRSAAEPDTEIRKYMLPRKRF